MPMQHRFEVFRFIVSDMLNWRRHDILLPSVGCGLIPAARRGISPPERCRIFWLVCFISACGVGQSTSAHADVLIAGRCSRTSQGTTTSSALLIHGEIRKGDASAFTTLADELARDTRCPMVGSPLNPVPMIFVKLDSQGGNIMEALAIGREIRRRFMVTGVPYANMECDSACVFVLMAGVNRIGGGKIGLHRPAFDPAFFADLSPTAARSRYNTLVEQLRQYYVDEMGGSPEAFRIIMTTPSTSIRYLSQDEMLALGIVGEDPAWAEYNEAQFIQRYGRERWAAIAACLKNSRDFARCEAEGYRLHPNR